MFANDAVSIEPYATPDFAKETQGLNAILEKGKKFAAMVEQRHGTDVSEPIIAGNSFAMTLTLEVTMKGQGRMKMSELCVYEVKDGKLISESFHI